MKKGFTLIELLAVIVILAIIAVIAVPIVLDIINDSKESAQIRSGEFYLKAVDNSIMQYKLKNNKKYKPNECLIDGDGNLWCDELTVKIEVDVDGKKPDGGTIFFTQGQITTSELVFGEDIIRTNEEGTLTKVENSATTSEYDIVYFDVSTGKSCKESDYDVSNSKTGYNGIDDKTGKQNGCLKFYKLSEEGNNVNLLLDHNTEATVAWNKNEWSSLVPNDVLIKLKGDTQNWKGTLTPSSYKVNDSYTVDYTGYNARLITIEEILEITGHTSWVETEEHNYYFFATKTRTQSETCMQGNTSGCKYGWLYDRTSKICKSTGCLNNASFKKEIESTAGYWTVTYKSSGSNHVEHRTMCEGHVKYGVSYLGRVGYACSNNEDHYGVRPVITVSKSSI